MKDFLLDIIPSIQRFSRKLDEKTILLNQHWVLLDTLEEKKLVFIFRKEGQLLVSINGEVLKGSWEHLSSGTMLIEYDNRSTMYRNAFFDPAVLVLKKDGQNNFSVFINESKKLSQLISLTNVANYLNQTYKGNLLEPENLEPSVATSDTTYSKASDDSISKEYTGEESSEDWMIALILFVLAIGAIVLIAVIHS